MLEGITYVILTCILSGIGLRGAHRSVWRSARYPDCIDYGSTAIFRCLHVTCAMACESRKGIN